MKHGFYFLASLDGAPLADRDLAVMGFDRSALFAPDAALAVSDIDGAAIHVRKRDDGIDALLGYLDEPEALAATLKQDVRTSPLELACMGLERFGDMASVEIAGQWTLLRWHAPSGALTLLTSERRRDTHYLATNGTRVAVAPEMRRLGKLDWVDGGFDERGFLLRLGRAPLRRGLGDVTQMRGVTSCREGTRVEVRAHDTRTTKAQPLVALPPRQLSFDDAIEEIESLLRRMMRQHLQRYPRTAIMLSGGLDSSVLAWLASTERDAAEKIVLLTSAAPPGSGLPEETPYARLIAGHLDLPVLAVIPSPESNVYRPSPSLFEASEAPLLSTHHFLEQAFDQQAAAIGARTVLNGNCGELTITNYAEVFRPSPWRVDPLRQLARAGRDSLRERQTGRRWPDSAFHLRLSPAVLARVPQEFADIWGEGHDRIRRLRPQDPFGIEPGATKSWAVPTARSEPDVRDNAFLIDPRLLRLFGAMPASLVNRDGLPRAPARAILRDRVPENVWRKPVNLPFSPTHEPLLQSQASAAHARIASYRAEGLAEWIDLDWLELTLGQVTKSMSADIGAISELQLTSMTAEYLLWAKTQA